MKKEKNIKAYQRRTKTGKMVTVKAHTAKYDAAEELKKAAARALGAGGELMSKKAKRQEVSPYDDFGFTKDEFSEWYEGTGSKADKKVEKALKKILGRKAYTELNDRAADSYKAGGAHKFFTKESKSFSSADSPSSAYKEAKKRYVDNMPKAMTVEEAIKYHKKNAPKKNEFGDRIGVTKSDEAKLRQYLSGERDFPKASDILKSLRNSVHENKKEGLDVERYKDGFSAGGTKEQWKSFLKAKKGKPYPKLDEDTDKSTGYSKVSKVPTWTVESAKKINSKESFRKLSKESRMALNDFIRTQYKGQKYDLGYPSGNVHYVVDGYAITNEGGAIPESRKKFGVRLKPVSAGPGDPGSYRYLAIEDLKKYKMKK